MIPMESEQVGKIKRGLTYFPCAKMFQGLTRVGEQIMKSSQTLGKNARLGLTRVIPRHDQIKP